MEESNKHIARVGEMMKVNSLEGKICIDVTVVFVVEVCYSQYQNGF